MRKRFPREVFQLRPLIPALAACFMPALALAQATTPAAPAAAASAPEAPASAPVSAPAAAPVTAGTGPTQLPPVMVTAERRTENARNIPSSISTLSGEKLDVLMTSGEDVRVLSGRVPSLNIESSFGRAFPRFYMRGYGNTDFRTIASQPVSLVYDEVVQENPMLKGFPIFDLARVESLAGPQGSLFGRNTPAGVVKFDSVAPEIGATDGYGNLSFGTFKTTNVEVAKSIPLGDQWALRVAGLYQYRDDWVKNTNPAGPTQEFEGYNDGAVRIQALYKPGGGTSALFNVHARDLTGSARLFRGAVFKPGTNDLKDDFDERKISTDGANEQKIQSYGGSARLRFDLGGDLSLNAITGFETVHVYSRGDIDGSSGPYFSSEIFFPSETASGLNGHRQFTQEFRVESAYKGPLNWLAGLYYFNEKFVARSFSYDTGAGGVQTGVTTDTQKSNSWALFGSVKYDVTSDLGLRVGLRYTRDKKDLESDPTAGIDVSEGYTAHLSDSKPTGDVALIYKVTPDTNVYARLATGYRGSSVQPASAFGPQSVAGQENALSYEAGVKSDLMDKRARVAFNVYQYRVKDLQLTEVGGGGNSNTLKTAEKVVGQGFELNLDAYLTPQLLVTLSGSLNDTKIKDPSLAVAGCGSVAVVDCVVTDPAAPGGGYYIDGNPLPQAPKWIANVTARYGMPMGDGGELFVYTDWAYRSKVNFFLYESVTFTGKPLLTGGLRIGYTWANGKYEAAAFGRNITNKVVAVGGIDFNNLTGFINDPRTFGVQFKAAF